jgi:hypothetical protein
MQLGHALALLLTLSSAQPARACAIALGTGGTLALSADGTRLGSGEGGVAGTFTVVNLISPAATLTVSPPVLVTAPPGFDSGGAQLQAAYFGAGLLSTVSQDYTAAPSSFVVAANLGLSVVTLNNRIVSATGFASGTYQTRTVITCS